VCFSRRGKRTPAFIFYQERRRLAANRQHKAKIAAEEERLHDVAVVTATSLSAVPSPSPPSPQPQAVPPPRAVRRLSMDNEQAVSPPPRSPSPERAASPVVAVPAAPRKDQFVSESDRPRRSQPVARVQDGTLYVHKKYEGRLPICYYDTGLRGYGPQDGYACFDRRDMLWARRLRFHIDHLRYLYC